MLSDTYYKFPLTTNLYLYCTTLPDRGGHKIILKYLTLSKQNDSTTYQQCQNLKCLNIPFSGKCASFSKYDRGANIQHYS